MRHSDVAMQTDTEHDLLRRWVYLACSSPWVELLGVALGVGTGWYLRQSGTTKVLQRQRQRQLELRTTSPATGEEAANAVDVRDDLKDRSALPERLARGLPVLGATWLWQVLIRLDGPSSLLDPLAAILAWFFLEMVLVSIPPSLWTYWDLGKQASLAAAAETRQSRALPLPTPDPMASIPSHVPVDEGLGRENYIEEVAPLTPAKVEAGATGSSVPCSAWRWRQPAEGRGTVPEGGAPRWPAASAEKEESKRNKEYIGERDDGDGKSASDTTATEICTCENGRKVTPTAEESKSTPGESFRGSNPARGDQYCPGIGRTRRAGIGEGACASVTSSGGAGDQRSVSSAVGAGVSSAVLLTPHAHSVKRRSRSQIGLGAIAASNAGISSSCPADSRGRRTTPRPLSPPHSVFPESTPEAASREVTPRPTTSRHAASHLVTQRPTSAKRKPEAAAEVVSAPRTTETNLARGGSHCRSRRLCRRGQTNTVEPTRAAGGGEASSLPLNGDGAAGSSTVSGTISGTISFKRPHSSSAGSTSTLVSPPATTVIARAAKKGRQTTPDEGLSTAAAAAKDLEKPCEQEGRRKNNDSKDGKETTDGGDSERRRSAAPGAIHGARVSSAFEAVPTCVERVDEGGETETDEQGKGKEGVTGWRGRGESLIPGDFDGEEEGTPVPPEFRPPGQERDVLCEWSLSQLKKDEEVGMFARGAFGKVLAVRTKSGVPIAVKVVERSALSPERYIERELEILKRCSVHPQVVELLGVIRTEERVYVLMPLADTDLAAMIKSNRLDEKQTGFCVRQVVSALEFLHGRRIVHRDIKPANILVLSNKVLLADFGLAKEIPRVQRPEMVGACGTKAYMAPELVRDLPYDESVDLWAVGVVTFELLHGYTPFKPTLAAARSWDGVVREEHTKTGANVAHGDGRDVASGSVSESVSESSGSIVNRRMFERSAPAAPGGGLERAWVVGQVHEALLFGKEDEGGRVDFGGGGGGGDAWKGRGRGRRGHREADQLRLLDNIVRGEYRVRGDRVGETAADFIRQLLQTSPARRMSAARSAEHAFLGRPSKVFPRRRATRAEVAAITAERASRAAEHHKARVKALSPGFGGGQAALAVGGGATATAAALSEIANLAAAMAAEARAAQADAKRWEKAAAEAEAKAEAAQTPKAVAKEEGADGSLGPPLGLSVADEAVTRAEAAVQRAELFGREAQAGEAAAAAAAAEAAAVATAADDTENGETGQAAAASEATREKDAVERDRGGAAAAAIDPPFAASALGNEAAVRGTVYKRRRCAFRVDAAVA